MKQYRFSEPFAIFDFVLSLGLTGDYQSNLTASFTSHVLQLLCRY